MNAIRKSAVLAIGPEAFVSGYSDGGQIRQLGDDTGNETVSSVQQGQVRETLSGESKARAPVSMNWDIGAAVPRTGAVRTTSPVGIVLKNETVEAVTVDVSMVGIGLDQRVSTVAIGSYVLSGGEQHRLTIRLDALRVQSVGAPGQVDFMATCTAKNWKVALSAKEMLVQYEQDYRAAYVSLGDTWAPVALGLAGGDRSCARYKELLADPFRAIVRNDVTGKTVADIDPKKGLMALRASVYARRETSREVY